MATIKLMNVNRKMPISVYAFDGTDVVINPTGQPVEVDEKFNWNLPKGIKLVREKASAVEVKPPATGEIDASATVNASGVAEDKSAPEPEPAQTQKLKGTKQSVNTSTPANPDVGAVNK